MEVFVYGTLTDPDRARAVLGGEFEYGPGATLVGLRRVEGRYPTLAPPEPGREAGSERDRPTVGGRILRTDRVGDLDDYEGVGRGLYVRVHVPVRGDPRTVEAPGEEGTATDPDRIAVYVGDPDRLGVDGVEWPGDGEFGDQVRDYVADAAVWVSTQGDDGEWPTRQCWGH